MNFSNKCKDCENFSHHDSPEKDDPWAMGVCHEELFANLINPDSADSEETPCEVSKHYSCRFFKNKNEEIA